MSQYFKSSTTGRIYRILHRKGSSSMCSIVECNNDDHRHGVRKGHLMEVKSSNLIPLSPQELHVLKTELAGNRLLDLHHGI